jgi:Putative amidase domain
MIKVALSRLLPLILLSISLNFHSADAQSNSSNKQDQQKVESELLSIAEASLKAERDVQVDGDGDGARRRNPKISRIRDAKFQQRLTRAKDRKNFLRSKRIGFKGHQTRLDIKSVTIENTVATLRAVENSTRFYDLSIMDAGSPEKTQELKEYIFTFNLKDNQWELISSETANDIGSVQGTAGEKIPSLPIDSTVMPSDPTAPSTNDSSKSTLKNFISPEKSKSSFLKDFSAMPNLIAQNPLNRQAIVQYIYYYALTPNKKYRDYSMEGNKGGDCTNFVSQALQAGGWSRVDGGHRESTSWWYGGGLLPPYASWTWIGADSFFKFINGRPRAKTIGRIADLVPGDVISVDLNPSANDGIDHTMLVSKKTASGIFLAYHTTNTLDKSFTEFYNINPGANYYAWSLLPTPQ